MRPLTNETFVVFDDKVHKIILNFRQRIYFQSPGSRVVMFASQDGLKRLVFSLNWYFRGLLE